MSEQWNEIFLGYIEAVDVRVDGGAWSSGGGRVLSGAVNSAHGFAPERRSEKSQ